LASGKGEEREGRRGEGGRARAETIADWLTLPSSLLVRSMMGRDGVVKQFAETVVAPKVREMDENERMDPEIIKGLFEQGVSDPSPHSLSGHLFHVDDDDADGDRRCGWLA
jgi:hypothetical protein